ncbi:hypothetical protein V1478_013825, partial [Vespula squamosa]
SHGEMKNYKIYPFVKGGQILLCRSQGRRPSRTANPCGSPRVIHETSSLCRTRKRLEIGILERRGEEEEEEDCEWLNEVASNLRWQKVFGENGDLERARDEEEVKVEACGRMGEYRKRVSNQPCETLKFVDPDYSSILGQWHSIRKLTFYSGPLVPFYSSMGQFSCAPLRNTRDAISQPVSRTLQEVSTSFMIAEIGTQNCGSFAGKSIGI